MKYFISGIMLFLSHASQSQIVDASYLNPTNINSGYKFVRLGNTSSYFGGIMHNINSDSFGNTDDFTIFSYSNRDIVLRSGDGHIFLSKNDPSSLVLGSFTNPKAISSSSPLFSGSIPKIEVNTGKATESYEELMVLRHSNSSSSATTRRLGFLFKMGSESFSQKSGGMIVESISPWANVPNMHLVTANEKRLTIEYYGNVGIGITNPSHKLDVNGTIHAKEVLVDLNFPGPDYVFEEDYNLTSLSELDQYLKENKHLPEVPSAKEMEKEGVNMVEMDMLLLKKVEELTLHLINQQNEITALKNEIQQLKK